MKCKNLMFGDWVDAGKGFPMQITSAGDNWAYATYEGNEEDLWEFSDNSNIPMPIPITREFLEKNGFEWCKTQYTDCFVTKWFQDKKIYFEWREGNNTFAIWFDYDSNNDGVYADIVVPVRYVHEMQQVLRLAGLDDFANNFKV